MVLIVTNTYAAPIPSDHGETLRIANTIGEGETPCKRSFIALFNAR
jgi:hypothetical protein